MQFSEIRKTVINVLTVVVTAGPWVLKAMDILPGSSGTAIATVVSAVLGVAGVLLHYLVPNTTDNPQVAETSSVVYRPKAGRKKVAAKPGVHPHASQHAKPDLPPPDKPVL